MPKQKPTFMIDRETLFCCIHAEFRMYMTKTVITSFIQQEKIFFFCVTVAWWKHRQKEHILRVICWDIKFVGNNLLKSIDETKQRKFRRSVHFFLSLFWYGGTKWTSMEIESKS